MIRNATMLKSVLCPNFGIISVHYQKVLIFGCVREKYINDNESYYFFWFFISFPSPILTSLPIPYSLFSHSPPPPSVPQCPPSSVVQAKCMQWIAFRWIYTYFISTLLFRYSISIIIFDISYELDSTVRYVFFKIFKKILCVWFMISLWDQLFIFQLGENLMERVLVYNRFEFPLTFCLCARRS